MKLGPRAMVYIAAVAALAVGIAAYGLSEEGDEHEDEGLLAGDGAKVAVALAVLAAVGVVSFSYLAKNPPGER